jgi:hypothetical protein
MHGYLLTGKRVGHWHSLAQSHQARMLLASISVGVIAGILMVHIRLHLGISGHKGLFWITPVLAARLLGRCKAGASAGALAAATTCIGLGGHMGGGWLGLPLIALVAVVWDVVIHQVEHGALPWFLMIPLIALLGAGGNLIVLGKRLLAPPGPNAIHIFGFSGLGFDVVSYAVCGLVAGLIAVLVAYGVQGLKARKA